MRAWTAMTRTIIKLLSIAALAQLLGALFLAAVTRLVDFQLERSLCGMSGRLGT